MQTETSHESAASGANPQPPSHPVSIFEGKDEPVIDIAQVMAANQVLLKNMPRKLDHLENSMKNLEGALSDARQKMELTINQRLLLEAPARNIEAWKPELPPMGVNYCSQFDWWTRWFTPEQMRRSRAG